MGGQPPWSSLTSSTFQTKRSSSTSASFPARPSAKHVGRDLLAGIKNIFGGELESYTELLSEAREEAMKRMEAQARSLGANAIVNVRFSTSSVAAGAAELYVYGTAVKVAG